MTRRRARRCLERRPTCPTLPLGTLGARGAARPARVPARDHRRARQAAAASRSTARGSCGCRKSGRCELDDDFDRDLLRHVWVLKLADEEAEVLGDSGALGVREVVVTHGSRGSTVYCRRARARTSLPAPFPGDPTGAGDAFATAYVVARNAGFAPAGAARRATAVVASLHRAMKALIATVAGSFSVDLETDDVEPWDGPARSAAAPLALNLPRRRRRGRRGRDGRRGRRREAAAPRLLRRRLDLARIRPWACRPAAPSRSRTTIPT